MSLRRSQAPGSTAAIDAALVAACAFAVHARAIGFGLVGLDDRDLLVDDAAFLSRPAALWQAFGRAYLGAVDAGHAYYRPLVTASLALDAHWGGTGFASYHATNVALHAAASVAVWMLLRRLYVGRVAAWISAAAFAVHPALTSTVAWIPGRNDSLLALLCVSSWLAFLARRRVVHLVLFACALLTKETAIALPLVCGAHALLLDPPLAGRLAAHSAGWLALIGARLAVWPPSSGSMPLALELTRWVRSLLGGLGELALPLRPIAIAVAQDLPVVPGVAALLGIALATVALRGVRRRVVALGVASFFLWLLPPVLATGSLVLGQRLYLPAVGGAVVLAELLRAAAPDPPVPQAHRVVAAWGGVGLVALAAVTLAFQGTFRDPRSFAREAVDASPHCALAHFCLGQSLQRDGDDDRALAEYRTALTLGAVEVVHNNVAVILMKRALWPEAASELEQEIASNPGYARAHLNLAVVLRHEGKREDACRWATTASELTAGDGMGSEIDAERARDCDRHGER
jgi:protein O-mannosyl-transferase